MKANAMTEAEMRDTTAPTPETTEQLGEYIASLVERQHDYGTCVYAMSLAAAAAFNYVAGKLGVTGFQASCADLDFIRRTRMMAGPFILLKAEEMCYPQYDLPGKLREAMQGWMPWAAKECAIKLKTCDGNVHPAVKEHWQKLAAFKEEKGGGAE